MTHSLLLASTETTSTNLLDLLLQGGWAMIPLGLFSMGLLFLVFHGWLQTRESGCIDPVRSHEIVESLRSNTAADLKHLGAQLPEAQQKVSAPLLQALRGERPGADSSEALEELLGEGLDQWESDVGQWVQYLNVIAATAPMVGLLGTVSGMISAFQTIASGGMGKPELLAGDIGEALITTATGLVIGIPAMLAYFVLKNRLNRRIQGFTQTAKTWIEARGAAEPQSAAKPPIADG